MTNVAKLSYESVFIQCPPGTAKTGGNYPAGNQERHSKRVSIAVFCYGTLAFPEIMGTVTGRRFPSVEARLDGYGRYLIKNAVYPGIIAEPRSHTTGMLYKDIDPESLRRLDRYEDRLYVRRTLAVRTAHDEAVSAEVYVIPEHKRWALSFKPWGEEKFARYYLRRYLERLTPAR